MRREYNRGQHTFTIFWDGRTLKKLYKDFSKLVINRNNKHYIVTEAAKLMGVRRATMRKGVNEAKYLTEITNNGALLVWENGALVKVACVK